MDGKIPSSSTAWVISAFACSHTVGLRLSSPLQVLDRAAVFGMSQASRMWDLIEFTLSLCLSFGETRRWDTESGIELRNVSRECCCREEGVTGEERLT